MTSATDRWREEPIGPPPTLSPWRQLPTTCRYCTAKATLRGYADRAIVPFANGVTMEYDPEQSWDACEAHSDRLFEEVEEVAAAFPIRETWRSWLFGHYLDSRVGRWLDRRLRPDLYKEDRPYLYKEDR